MWRFLAFFVVLGLLVSVFVGKRKGETEREHTNRVASLTTCIIGGFIIFALLLFLIILR